MHGDSDREWGGPFVLEALRDPTAGEAAVPVDRESPFALEGETPPTVRLNVSVSAGRRSGGTFWQRQNDLALTCGDTLASITGSALATFADGRTQDVTASIRWRWNNEDRGTGAHPSGLESLAPLFEKSTNTITILAQVDLAGTTTKVSINLRMACTLAGLGTLTDDEKRLARLVYAEAGDVSDLERAAIAWSIKNRVAKIAAGDPEAKRSFGATATIQAVVEHRDSKGQIQYKSYSEFRAGSDRNAVANWNAIDRPGSLACLACSRLRSAVTVARGVLSGAIADPYGAQGGTFYFHLEEDGVIEGDRKYSIVRLPRNDFVHHFWTYAPPTNKELKAEAELYGGPAPSLLASSWRSGEALEPEGLEPTFEQLTTDAIAGPVGRGQASARDDVLRVQGRLRELGMTWVTATGTIDDPTDRAIRLWRAIIDTARRLDDGRSGGTLAPGSPYEQWLRSPAAPRWLGRVPDQRDGWCVNNSNAAACSPDDGSHGMTSWLAEYLDQVGGAFRGKVAALRTVLDAYVGGHRAALDRLASPPLPRVGPYSDVEQNALRTRDVARRVIADLVDFAATRGLDPEALARTTRDAIAAGAALLSVGNIARPQGGHFPPHEGHQTGLEFDLRLFGHGGPEEGLVWSRGGCSRLLVGVAIDCFLEHSHTAKVIYNDPDLVRRAAGRVSYDRGTPAKPGKHDTHVHVSIRGAGAHTLVPPADPATTPGRLPPGPQPELGAEEVERDIERFDPPPVRRAVYLTFDDGLQLGTREVVDVLQRNDARATFFLTGAHVAYYEKKPGPGLLKTIAGDPRFEIGNHSQSHANQRTGAFYAGGIVLRNGTRRPVLDDFRLCDATIARALGRPSAPLPLGRLPGRNAWRVKNLPAVDDSTNDKDSADEADALSQAGYQIFGWDAEWFMDFGGTKDVSDYDPDVDPSDRSNDPGTYRSTPTLDRPIEKDARVIAAQLLKQLADGKVKRPGKLVLLMHDRAFRPADGPDTARFTHLLEVLVQELKAAGVALESLSTY